MTDQMTKVPLNHELESLCCTGGVTGDHGTAGHDLADRCRVRIETVCSDLSEMVGTAGVYVRKGDILYMPSPWQ